MTFVDGWVCQSCWKSNRPRDTRCYRCKTERGADKSTIEAAQRLRISAAGRAGRVPEIVSILPAAVFRWYARFAFVVVALLVIGMILAAVNPRAATESVPLLLAFTAATLAFAMGLRWASGAMVEGRAVGFAVGLVVSVAMAGLTIWALGSLSSGGNPNWMRFVTIGAFATSAILALVGLLFSLRGDESGSDHPDVPA